MDASPKLDLLKGGAARLLKEAILPVATHVGRFAHSVLFGSIGSQMVRGFDRGAETVLTRVVEAIPDALPDRDIGEILAKVDAEMEEERWVSTEEGSMSKSMAKSRGVYAGAI